MAKAKEDSGEHDKVLPEVCPFAEAGDSQVIRRQDLVELADDFKEALKPVGTVIEHVKESNFRYTRTNSRLKHVTWWLAAVVVLLVLTLGAVLYALYTLGVTAKRVDETATRQGNMEQQFQTTATELGKVRTTTEDTQQKMAKAKEREDSKPTVELVPEEDPVKARKSPLKVRVTAPKGSAVPTPTAVHVLPRRPAQKKPKSVEIPISAEAL